MLLELLCFGRQAGSLGLPPKTSFYFKSVKDTICPVYFSSVGVHMDGIDSFVAQAVFVAMKVFWSHAGSILWSFSSSLQQSCLHFSLFFLWI